MIYPALNILMPSLLELLVVLTRVWNNFWEPLIIHIVYIILVNWVPNHSHVLNGGKACFNEDDKLRCIAFNFEIISSKIIFVSINILKLLVFFKITPSFIPQWFNPNITSLCHPYLSWWFWLEFETIFGSLFASMLFFNSCALIT